jgi:pimeloyl-ACP methyl ester carboxylesterase
MKHPALSVTLLGLTLTLPTRIEAETLSWGPCPTAAIAGPVEGLGGDLRCALFNAPLDHAAPEKGTTTLAVARVKASDPANRLGTLVFENGGPASNGLANIGRALAAWRGMPPGKAPSPTLRNLVDRFDVIYVLPREIFGNSGVSCEGFAGKATDAAMADLNNNTAWRELVDETRKAAAACSNAGRYAGTWQHVRDLEYVRQQLGERQLHFYAVSYGTWIAAHYAAQFPATSGRMLLDSSVNITASAQQNYAELAEARNHVVATMGVAPAARQHDVWGLGDTTDAVWARLQSIPFTIRRAWTFWARSQEDLMAAVSLYDFYRTLGPEKRGRAAMTRFAEEFHYHPVDKIDAAVRNTALKMAADFPESGKEGVSIPFTAGGAFLAVMCNDSPWDLDPDELRTRARFAKAEFTFWSGEDITIPLICRHWVSPPHPQPSLDALRKHAPFVMLHAQGDIQTPYWGAQAGALALPNARLVMVAQTRAHTVLSHDYPCSTAIGLRYLLNGDVPEEHLTYCRPDGVKPVPRDEL